MTLNHSPGPIESSMRANRLAVQRRLGSRLPTAVSRPKPVVRHVLMQGHPAWQEAKDREAAARALLAVHWKTPDPAPYDLWPPSCLTEIAPAPTQKEIVAQVCTVHGVRMSQILGPARDRELVLARQELCYRLRTERNLTWAQIGRFVGRDHTTVLYSYRTHAKRVGKPV